MKVAVIGTGFGERVMAQVYRELGFDVDVISPRDPEGVAAACASQVDLLSVHAPPFMHHDIVMRALDHGRNILCDKPFGRDAAEARAMRDRAVDAGVLHFLNFEFRRGPARVKARELLDSGAIGTPTHISWQSFGSGFRNRKHGWLFDRDLAGGWIGAYGSHAIDGLRFLFGSEVRSCGGIMRTETTVRAGRDGAEHTSTAEDAFSGWFVMDNGATATIDTAYSTPLQLPQRLIMLGSEGGIEIINDLELILRRPGTEDERFTFAPSDWDPHEPALRPWLEQVKVALETGRQLTPSFEDGWRVTEAMEQLRRQAVDLRAAG